jgi:SAM-dependent methyltransferase
MATPILFANYGVPNCGVHQYGKSLYRVLKGSSKYDVAYADVKSMLDLDEAMSLSKYALLLVNYHPQTFAFAHPDTPPRYGIPVVAVMHEMTQDESEQMPRRFVQYYVMGDPTLRPTRDYVFSTGRILPHYENKKPMPAIPTIGSIGFSVGTKGFQRLVTAVQEEFDEALIRINIPANGIIDREAASARQQAELCRQRLHKPGVKLEVTHDFLDDQQLLEFLASNSLNAFLYDYIPRGGISSSPDHAMVVRRPLAVSRSVMFRHLHGVKPSITFEDSSLRAIMENGIAPYENLLREWSPESVLAQYEGIIAQALARGAKYEEIERPAGGNESWSTKQDSGEKTVSLQERVIQAVRRRAAAYKYHPSYQLVKRAEFTTRVKLGLIKPKSQLNRILDDQARLEYADVIEEIRRFVPDLVAKKIDRANIQQAFVFDTARHFARRFSKPRVLCIGSYEDSASASMKASGYDVVEIDPVVNQLNLDTFFNLPTTKPGTFDVVFSTSVIEHVKDDELFMKQIAALLAPGGVGVLTCDYKQGYQPGDPVISGDFRFYTERDLSGRLLTAAAGCEYVDTPKWDCPEPDFFLGGFNYTFATMVFRKR